MNVLQDLKALAAQASTDHVKQLLASEIAKVEGEAKAAVETVHDAIGGAISRAEAWVTSELKAAWESIRKVL